MGTNIDIAPRLSLVPKNQQTERTVAGAENEFPARPIGDVLQSTKERVRTRRFWVALPDHPQCVIPLPSLLLSGPSQKPSAVSAGSMAVDSHPH